MDVKKRGRKPKPKVEQEVKIPKKRGRKPKPKPDIEIIKVPKKRGRKPKIKTEEDSWKKIERDDFFVANTWEIEYKTKPNIEIEMTDEEKELEKQADELLKNANQ